MKSILFSLAGVAAGFLVAYFAFFSRPTGGPGGHPPQTPVRSAEPAREAASPATPPTIRKNSESTTAAVSESATGSATEILDKLKRLRIPPGPRRQSSARQLIHLLATLGEQGSAALPAIRDFMAKFEDVDYLSESAREEEDEASGGTEDQASQWYAARTANPVSRRPPRLDSITPPSLRLGLVDVLREIGGTGAEQILAEVLSGSGRSVEVAYVARALQEVAPEKYKDAAIAAARDLLANAPKLDRPNKLDENAKSYLYSVLELYGDSAIAANAPNIILTPDGHIDRTALTYLAGSLKEQAVPALYQAYKDARLTNVSDRAVLASQILTHAGLNQQANDAFREMVFDEKAPSWMRALTIQSLAGGRGPISTTTPVEPAQIQARLDLLNSLPDFGDERMTRARGEVIERLSNRLSTVTATAESARTFRDRAGQSAPAGAEPAATPPVP